MKQISTKGIYQKTNKLYTVNPPSCKNRKVYGENLRTFKGIQYRSWNPYRSKLAALLLKKPLRLPLHEFSHLLYLGAATGTTVSHISDMLAKGWIYAVEPSPVAATTLMILVKQRENIIPIIEDANHPDRYIHMISNPVDFLYQDISQRNQAEIFSHNAKLYLKDEGKGILMVKARSIDVSIKPRIAYDQVKQQLEKQKLIVKEVIELSPYEKDHAAIYISKK